MYFSCCFKRFIGTPEHDAANREGAGRGSQEVRGQEAKWEARLSSVEPLDWTFASLTLRLFCRYNWIPPPTEGMRSRLSSIVGTNTFDNDILENDIFIFGNTEGRETLAKSSLSYNIAKQNFHFQMI